MSRLGGWVRWIGWIGVRDAGRDLCGVDHLRHAQGYGPTATENGTAGRGDIHTNAIRSDMCFNTGVRWVNFPSNFHRVRIPRDSQHVLQQAVLQDRTTHGPVT